MSIPSSNLYNYKGIQLPPNAFVVIVRTQWNAQTMDRLEAGCIKILNQFKVNYKTIEVPGAVEISFAIKKYWETITEKPTAFIALGCVLKGDTPHFDFVCKAVTEGVVQLNLLLPVPTIFGVLTVNNQQQIEERLGGIHGHKGEEAAMAALQMMSITNQF